MSSHGPSCPEGCRCKRVRRGLYRPMGPTEGGALVLVIDEKGEGLNEWESSFLAHVRRFDQASDFTKRQVAALRSIQRQRVPRRFWYRGPA